MKLPNLMAVLRLVLLPAIIWAVLQETAQTNVLAITLLSIAFLWEFFEGYLVRKKGFDSFLRPFSNRILVMGLLFFFFLAGEFYIWFLVVFILRDLIVSWVRWLAARDDAVVKYDYFSKLTIYFQFGIIFMVLLVDLFYYQGWGRVEWLERGFILFNSLAGMMAIASITYNITTYWKKLRQRKKLGKEIKGEELIVLVNKRSRGHKDRYRRHLLKTFVKKRKAQLIYLSDSKEMFHNVEELVKDKKNIIIAGGDGSFESALNYHFFRKKSLGFFPLGAGNAYYSYFYKGKRFEYLRSRFPFREVEMDVMEVVWDKGRRETMWLSVGVDSEVIRLSKDGRTQHGFRDYFKAATKAAFKLRIGHDLEVVADGKKMELENTLNLSLGKVPYYGYGIRSLMGDVGLADGEILGMAVINSHSMFMNKAVRLWALLLQMMGMKRAPLFSIRGKEFTVRSEVPFPLQAGGEFLGFTQEIKVRVVRKQKVLVI